MWFVLEMGAWLALICEGLWFFAAFSLAPAPYPYQLWLSLLLWLSVVICVAGFAQRPLLFFITATVNAVGCAFLRSKPGGVTHPWLWFAYYRSLDLLDNYWATQVNIMRREVLAWSAQAEKKADVAVAILRSAADDEDRIEKLPATPGPIIPAREQLGDLLLEQGDIASASKAFETALVNAPGRRGALLGVTQVAHPH